MAGTDDEKMEISEEDGLFCLKWANFEDNVMATIPKLTNESADIILVTEDQMIKAHKSVLNACSSYFTSEFQDPQITAVILDYDIPFSHLEAILQFMYTGQTIVSRDQVTPLLKTAKILKVKGLVDTSDSMEEG